VPRIRTIKPEFFKHEGIAALPYHARLAFIGLWTLADRDGRLEDRPRRIKTDVLPYDDEIDMDGVIGELEKANFVRRYSIGDRRVIEIPGFKKHQRITGKESETPSQLPAPPSQTMEKQGSTGATLEKEFRMARRQTGSIGESGRKISAFSNAQERKGMEGGREGMSEEEGISPESYSDDIPEGLDPSQYARGLLEQLCLPTSRSMIDVVASAIASLSKGRKIVPKEAFRIIRDRTRAANERRETINRFWFEDGRFNEEGGRSVNGKRQSRFAEQSEEVLRAVLGQDEGDLAD